ncbi:MAG: PKD domain-containing protein [Thermoplasmata archaeon]|nr:PKD domain-containing protein [Thermoplasmata archaeon]
MDPEPIILASRFAPYHTWQFYPVVTNATGSVTYSWNFGDNSAPSSQMEPVHSFPSSGTYTVTLKVTDSAEHVYTASFMLVVS